MKFDWLIFLGLIVAVAIVMAVVGFIGNKAVDGASNAMRSKRIQKQRQQQPQGPQAPAPAAQPAPAASAKPAAQANFCMHCGQALPEGAAFCVYCGTKKGAC